MRATMQSLIFRNYDTDQFYTVIPSSSSILPPLPTKDHKFQNYTIFSEELWKFRTRLNRNLQDLFTKITQNATQFYPKKKYIQEIEAISNFK